VTPIRRLLGTALLVPLALAALPAAGEVIDRILVHVNAKIITQSMLDERTEQALKEAPPGLDMARREEVRKASLKELVNEALLEDRARELDIVSTDAEVEESIKRLKEQNNVATEEDFVRALAASGLTPDQLRDQLKRSSTIQRVVGREVNSKVDLSDDALRLVYERDKEKWATPEKVRVAEVLVNPGPGAEEKAKEAAKLARSGTKFDDVVLRFSDGPTRSKGGDMGTVGRGDLAGALDAAAFSLPVGGISDPIETRSGWHVVKVAEKIPAGYRPFAEVKADILKKEQETQFQKKLAEYIEKLERGAVISVAPEAVALYQPPPPAPSRPDTGVTASGEVVRRAPKRAREVVKRFEVTPMAGYRYGGVASSAYSDYIESLEVEPGLSYGLTFEYAFRPNATFEILWSHQDSALKLNYRQAPPPGYSEKLADLNIDTFQIGALWMFGRDRAKVRPYIDLLLGASILNPTSPFDTLVRFSGSVGGGAKLYFSDLFAARLGLRFMPVYINSTSTGYAYCDPWWGCYSYYDANYLNQWDAYTGLTVRF
jgi:peptidyl-prolyl cis-trans isomerase SurA